MKERDIISIGSLVQEATNGIRGFQSRFDTKILSVSNWYNNLWQVETFLDFSLSKMLGIKTDCYFDDRTPFLTSSYPFIIEDHFFLLHTDSKIEGYADYILEQLVSAKKGYEVSQKKLSNTAFVDKAPTDIVNLERNKLEDFGFKWELWTKAYLIYNL
jgi:valyl-tRNA synthetase